MAEYENVIYDVVSKIAREWKDLTAEQQRDYLMRHRRSKRRFGPKEIKIPFGSELNTAQKKFKGSLSDDVAHSYNFKHYIGDGDSHPGGYFGASNRTPDTDHIVENELRKQGLEGEGIASWLTSTSGRHLMNDVPEGVRYDGADEASKKFRKRVRDYTKNAFIDVLIWSHPDHTGSIASTNRLKELILNKLQQEKEHPSFQDNT